MALEKNVRRLLVASAFSPGAPVRDERFFAARDQYDDAMRALFHPDIHIALYGERGVGKTSLAKMLPELIRGAGLPTLDAVRINCNTADTFPTIWRRVFRELKIDVPDHVEDPDEVRYIFQQKGGSFLIALDELDRMEDEQTRSLLADTIKTLSDNSVDVTLMLVGIADTIGELIGDHKSIVRSLQQIRMPRMSDHGLTTIITKGIGYAQLEIAPDAAERIVQLSEGLPHYTHLLAQHAAFGCVDNDDAPLVTIHHLNHAISKAVEDPQSLRQDYHLAVQSAHTKATYDRVLLACAFAARDEFAYFRPSAVRKPLSILLDKDVEQADYTRHLTELTRDKRGKALQRVGQANSYRYRFSDPGMQPYTKLRALADGLITDEVRARLDGLRRQSDSAPGSPTLPF